jgi:hypothetical protein
MSRRPVEKRASLTRRPARQTPTLFSRREPTHIADGGGRRSATREPPAGATVNPSSQNKKNTTVQRIFECRFEAPERRIFLSWFDGGPR